MNLRTNLDSMSSQKHGSPAKEKPESRRGRTFAALKYPNYRLWFRGQIVSLFGTWMQTTAQAYLIYELTHSPAYLGYVGFATGVPAWLFTLYGGVVADRVSRRALLVITQSAMMVFAFVLATLAFLHVVQPWHVLGLSFLLGIANAFDAPARQAFVGEMVDREDLTNAIALNATMFHTATAIGPAVAGVTYALFGPAWCFTINGLSFIAVIAALQMMKVKPQEKRTDTGSVLSELKEGMSYIVHHDFVAVIIGIVAINSMFTLSINTLVPAWAVKILGGNATTNGFLQSSRGLGSLMGALLIATLGRISYRGKLLTLGDISGSRLADPVCSSPMVAGITGTLCRHRGRNDYGHESCNALVQTSTPEKLRGRVMGTYTWIFFGFMPIGALWTGEIAARFSLSAAIIINAVLALIAASVVWMFFPRVRQQ